MSKKLRKRVRKDLKESITDETVEERYERLKVGERTGMALSTYKKLDDAFKEMEKGDYGLYDGGTVSKQNEDGSWTEKVEYHRNAWYVGYRFMDGEEKVKEKVRGRMKSSGVFFATTDVHQDNLNDYDAVWMQVF